MTMAPTVSLSFWPGNRIRNTNTGPNTFGDCASATAPSMPSLAPFVFPSCRCDDAACDIGKSKFSITLHHHPSHPPNAWRQVLPMSVQAALITTTNCDGTVTNSDLELVHTIGQTEVFAAVKDLRERTLAVLSNDTHTMAWRTKTSTTTAGPASSLLGYSVLHQRAQHYIVALSHLPGTANHLADVAN